VDDVKSESKQGEFSANSSGARPSLFSFRGELMFAGRERQFAMVRGVIATAERVDIPRVRGQSSTLRQRCMQVRPKLQFQEWPLPHDSTGSPVTNDYLTEAKLVSSALANTDPKECSHQRGTDENCWPTPDQAGSTLASRLAMVTGRAVRLPRGIYDVGSSPDANIECQSGFFRGVLS